ncbi:NAD kinase [Lactococcus sp. LG606]|uniref:NAD kinase n=1 Tax=Lactococcus sp. LG606 TaxID=2816912 RepID=UPI001A8EE251|nr:NAD kinase [Lactococcus sp. LG606]QSR12624.1 NAD kinase [Lactococcus sp. LG606]
MSSGKKIWLVGNSSEKSQKTLLELTALLQSKNFRFEKENPEIVISVGGDGTLLKAMHIYEDKLDKIRFVGVHTGHLGFYTDFMNTDLDKVALALESETAEHAVHYPLLRIRVKFQDGSEMLHYALNESTIRRTSKTLVADIRISDFLFEKFRGDGLSVSTPTGSTAYNKSIGGAVLHPRVEAMQMAEIASLNNIVYRTLGAPMVVAKKDSIIICPEDVEDYSVTVDQLTFNYEKIEAIEYSMDGKTIAFANCAHTSFWERVKNAFIGEVE